VRAERRAPLRPLDRAEAEHLLVEAERALEVRDLEAHGPEARRVGQTVAAARRLAVGAGHRRLGGGVAEDVLRGRSHVSS
jgi:hypothetical protein